MFGTKARRPPQAQILKIKVNPYVRQPLTARESRQHRRAPHQPTTTTHRQRDKERHERQRDHPQACSIPPPRRVFCLVERASVGAVSPTPALRTRHIRARQVVVVEVAPLRSTLTAGGAAGDLHELLLRLLDGAVEAATAEMLRLEGSWLGEKNKSYKKPTDAQQRAQNATACYRTLAPRATAAGGEKGKRKLYQNYPKCAAAYTHFTTGTTSTRCNSVHRGRRWRADPA